jgi:hypothetical protein
MILQWTCVYLVAERKYFLANKIALLSNSTSILVYIWGKTILIQRFITNT